MSLEHMISGLEEYKRLQKRALQCKVRLLRSEVDAQTRISRWRTEVEGEMIQQLNIAQEKMTTELRRVACEREQEIDKTVEQAGIRMRHGDALDGNGLKEVAIRFEPYEAIHIYRGTSLKFGTLHVEHVTDSQNHGNGKGADIEEKSGIYYEIPSITSPISPLTRENVQEDYESDYENASLIRELSNHNEVMHTSKDKETSAIDMHATHCVDTTGNESDLSCRNQNRISLVNHENTLATEDRREASAMNVYAEDDIDITRNEGSPSTENLNPLVQVSHERNIDVENSVETSNFYLHVVDCLDLPEKESSYSTQDQYLYSVGKMTRAPSIETLHLFGGESLPQNIAQDCNQSNMASSCGPICNPHSKSCLVDNEEECPLVREWKTFHRESITPGEEMTAHSPKSPCSMQMSDLPDFYLKDMDSCRFVNLEDKRFILLCESNESLILFEKTLKCVTMLKLNQPKAICHVYDNHFMVVQQDCQGNNVLLVKANANKIHVMKNTVFGCHGGIFDLIFRNSKAFLGCNDGHIHIWSDKLEEVSVVTVEKLLCPCICLDYNLASDTMYVVSGNGTLYGIGGKDSLDNVPDCGANQATVVCCLDDKAYVLCCKGKYKVVNEVCRDCEPREVIRLAESNPIDMTISPDGQYLYLLHSDGVKLFIEMYTIQRHRH